MKKIALILMTVLMCLLLLCACKESTQGVDETTNTTAANTTSAVTTVDEALKEWIALADDEKSYFRIVYPYRSSFGEKECAVMLANKLKELTNNDFVISDDWSKDGKADEEAYEILVGKTNRALTAKAYEDLPGECFRVLSDKNKIALAAESSSALSVGVEKIIQLVNQKSAGTYRFEDKLEFTSKEITLAKIVKNDESEYKIVADVRSAASDECAFNLQQSIKKLTGVTLDIIYSTSPAAEYEIIIGNISSRDTSIASVENFGYTDYAIAASEDMKRVVITAKYDMLYQDAADKFVEIIKAHTSKSDGKCSSMLPSTSFGVYSLGDMAELPEFSYGKSKGICMNRDGSFTVYYSSVTEKDIKAYAEMLSEQGYTKISDNKIANSIFSVYEDKSSAVYINFDSNKGEVQIAADKTAQNPVYKKSGEAYEKITTPLLIQLNCAMSFIIRLSDSRFIVIDGGLSQDYYAKGIYDTLIKYNKRDGKPVIAAWLISHAHNDHMDAPNVFMRDYSGKYILESTIINVPSKKILLSSEEDNGTAPDHMTERTDRFDSLAKSAGATAYKSHAGIVYEFADAKIEMLYTQDMLYPKPMTVSNASSQVFRLTIGGQSIMFLGDCHTNSSSIISNLYKNELKSDYVQISHHGYNGGTTDLYKHIAPEYSLWTADYEGYLERKDYEQNKWVLQNTKKLIMTSKDPMVIELPIKPDSEYIIKD